MSKIRDAMRKQQDGDAWRPEPTPEPRPEARDVERPRLTLPATSPDVLAYYEAVGKQIEVSLGATSTRVLTFTGAVGGEGSSTVVAQYAEMLSRRGERVLLVDGNPRHPSQHQLFGVPDSPGLAEWVSGTADPVSVVHLSGFPNLDVVPLGRCADRSEAERISESLGEFQAEFAASYDYVLVDADFVGSPFSSGAAIHGSDGVVLVLRAGRTNRQIASRALDTVRQIGGNVLGVILNRREFPIPDFIYRHL
ncbi:MAG: CpsD/CapB family tyrosine-protein kinase [Gemmatimonadetes bacterium]|nr:CpsD/CapB family tyrosine-protein kinase [Gemmatimonadota bacterium]